jgi:hypothetical protein
MLRQLLSGTNLFDLPIAATLLFALIFAAVLVRVCRRQHANEYRRMASLPLTDDERPRRDA